MSIKFFLIRPKIWKCKEINLLSSYPEIYTTFITNKYCINNAIYNLKQFYRLKSDKDINNGNFALIDNDKKFISDIDDINISYINTIYVNKHNKCNRILYRHPGLYEISHIAWLPHVLESANKINS